MEELIINEGSKDEIQFLHANAYPPKVYLQLFNSFSNYKISLPRQRPLWPDSQANQMTSWHLFADDIIDHMSDKSRKHVIGIGHSMGGIVSMLAAIRKPDLFSRLILIDPVILSGMVTSVLCRLPYQVVRKIVPMVNIAARRRNTWSDRDKAMEYFQSKKVFQRFDADVLEDFVQYGLVESVQGVTLSFPREWESHIYASAPNVWSSLKKVTCPITIIKAEYSDVINQKRWERIKRLMPKAELIEFPKVGHLIPFEKPDELATMIKRILA